MSHLILVKHAASQANPSLPASEWALSDLGRVQCPELARRLAAYKPGLLFTSREPKAAETARLLAPTLTLQVQERPNLHENDRTGLAFFDDVEDLRQQIRSFFRHASRRVVGRESADEAYERFHGAVTGITTAEPASTMAVVSHGTVISLLVARANQLDPYAFWLELGFGSFAVLSTPTFELQEVKHLP